MSGKTKTDEEEALRARLRVLGDVIAEREDWRVREGMVVGYYDPARVYLDDKNEGLFAWSFDRAGPVSVGRRESPDLTDAATVTLVLEAARRLWRCDEYRRLTIEPAGAGWCIVVRNGRHRPPSRARPGWDLDRVAHPPRGILSPFGDNEFATEAEAVACAFLEAPR